MDLKPLSWLADRVESIRCPASRTTEVALYYRPTRFTTVISVDDRAWLAGSSYGHILGDAVARADERIWDHIWLQAESGDLL